MFRAVIERLATRPGAHNGMVGVAAQLNRLAIELSAAARQIVMAINRRLTNEDSDRFVGELPALHRRIADLLARQKAEYPHQAYFYGYPYQSLGILGIFGERATEERFDLYGLSRLIGPDDTILDIGCNCGFMAILTAYRTGCRAVGIDINPYMIEIGCEAAAFLKLSDRVELTAERFQDYPADKTFSVVFSFATHWTDDGNYRVELGQHFARIADFLSDEGLLIFETHCADVGSRSFYDAMAMAKASFDFDGCIPTDNGTRELYIMRKRVVG